MEGGCNAVSGPRRRAGVVVRGTLKGAGRSQPADRRHVPMAELTEKKRDALPESKFGLPDEKKYPMPDKSHARNAKARAAQQVKKGTITKSEKAKIDRKADRMLDK
jgi:hypothetical protein